MAQSVNFQINKVESCVTINYQLPLSDVKKLQNNEVGINSNQVNETHLTNSHVDNHASLFNLGGGQAIGKRIFDDSPDSHTRFVRFRSGRSRDDASYDNSGDRQEGSSYCGERNDSNSFHQSSRSSTTSPQSESPSSGFDATHCRYSPIFDGIRFHGSRYACYNEHEDSHNLPTSRRNSNVHFRSSEQSTGERREFNIRNRRPYYRNPSIQQTRSTASPNRPMSGYERERPNYSTGRENVRDIFFREESTDTPFLTEDMINVRRPNTPKNPSAHEYEREMKDEEFECLPAKYNRHKNPTSYF